MIVLDAGALVGVERGVRRVRGLLAEAGDAGEAALVPSAVLTQVWRGGGPRQALLSRFLGDRGVHVVAHGRELALAGGALLVDERRPDAVDASVVALALSVGARAVLTSDVEDLRRLAGADLNLVRV